MQSPSGTLEDRREPGRNAAAIAAWCVYDFGIAAWPVVIATFVWGVYFSTGIAHSSEEGAARWGATLSIAGFVVAVLGPMLGAIADRAGRRKPWIGVFATVCVVATASLWFSRPTPESAARTLLLVVLGSVSYEFGVVFYNASLRDVAPPSILGRVSGWGWGLGYVGGLGCLAVALVTLIKPTPALFGLDKVAAEPVRATAILVAFWIAAFVTPFFLLAPDRKSGGMSVTQAVSAGLRGLYDNLKDLPRRPTILRFLIARMIYADGLNTLFIFGGIYAAAAMGFALDEVLLFGIAINATAGLGAALFAWIDDWIGSKPTIVMSLACLIALGGAILFIHSKPWFWSVALALGVFVGPAQAASRTLMAHLVPRGLEAEMFGLYALTGKITAFTGPAIYGLAVEHFASQRAGMASVIVYLVAGLALLLTVRVGGAARVSA
ncbi:MAG TPA: MFS transporter [Alphaproteobacteria bacterium]|nr:MFS transporter [Alphaproteobacteria bacterium]